MYHVNQVIFIGNLGHDPEVLKSTEEGAFVRLKLATDEEYTDAKGKRNKTTQWHTVYLSNGLGKNVAAQLKKGNGVYVRGKLRTEKWDKNGQTQYTTAVHAIDCQLITPLKSMHEKVQVEA